MIRDLRQDDIPALLPLWRAYQDFFKAIQIDDEVNEKFIWRVLADHQNARLIGAFEGDEIVGYSSYFLSYASTACARLANINDLYVAPQWRRKGIGTHLLNAAIHGAIDVGAELVRWLANPDNLPAIQLYSRYGIGSEWQLFTVNGKGRPQWKS